MRQTDLKAHFRHPGAAPNPLKISGVILVKRAYVRKQEFYDSCTRLQGEVPFQGTRQPQIRGSAS